MENELNSFKTHTNSIEQQKLQSTCEIDGIPKTNNENLLEIVLSMSNKLNIKMANDDISNNFRSKNKQEKAGKTVVNFNSLTLKNEILNSVKKPAKSNNPLKQQT